MCNLLQIMSIKERSKKLHFIAIYLFLFFLAVYLITSSHWTVYATDASNARYQVTKSIVEKYDLSIPKGMGVEGIDGRDYSWFGLGSSALSIPFYVIGKLIGTPENAVSIMNLLIGSATVVLIFLFSAALGYSYRASVLVSIFYGLGTFAWPLAKQPFDHTVETFFVLFSVYLMYLYAIHRHKCYLFFSAFCLGFAFTTRLTSILVLPPLFIILMGRYSKQREGYNMIFIKTAKDMFLFLLVFFPFLWLNCWYNNYRFGSIFETGYSLIAMKIGLDFFSGTPLLTGLTGLLISPGKGFFYYSPIALLFFFSFRSFMKKHRSVSFAFLLIMISYLLFLSKNIFWHGDSAWGPRYLLVLTPFFLIPIAELLNSNQWRKNRFMRIALFSTFFVSLIIQLIAITVYFHIYFFHLAYDENVKFIVLSGKGVPSLSEPPPEVYFDWRYSPILKQLFIIREVAQRMIVYHYAEPPDDASIYDKSKTFPSYNAFDFWWIYRYFIEGSSSGFIIALILLLIAIYTAVKLRNTVNAYEDR
jgi:hypothetical protein